MAKHHLTNAPWQTVQIQSAASRMRMAVQDGDESELYVAYLTAQKMLKENYLHWQAQLTAKQQREAQE